MKAKLFVVFYALASLLACSGSRYDDAITAAVRYLNGRGVQLDPVAVPVLENLRAQFSINVDTLAMRKRIAPNLTAEQRVFYRNPASKQVASREEVRQLRGINHMTAAALYCDLYGLPPYFFRSLRKMANAGNYALTHAMLALVMVRGQRCAYDQAAYRRELNAEIGQLRQLISGTPVASDLGIEAILMLHLANKSADRVGEPSHVNPEWIEKILAAQSADGSWYQNDHTTVLALWLLLELRSAG